MKNVFDRLSPTLQLIVAALTACGLSLESLLGAGTASPESIGQRFTAIATQFKAAGLDLKAIVGGDFSSLSKLTDVGAAVELATKELQTQLATAQQSVTTATASVACFLAALGFKAEDLAVNPTNLAKFGLKDDADWQKLSAEQKADKVATAAVNAALSARTLAQVRELGFDVTKLPKSDAGGNGKDPAAELRAEYARLEADGKFAEASAFYAKNFEAMYPKSTGQN